MWRCALLRPLLTFFAIFIVLMIITDVDIVTLYIYLHLKILTPFTFSSLCDGKPCVFIFLNSRISSLVFLGRQVVIKTACLQILHLLPDSFLEISPVIVMSSSNFMIILDLWMDLQSWFVWKGEKKTSQGTIK